jgi:hypothetical protein
MVLSMKCSQCGQDNPPDNKFCDNCGLELASASATAPTLPTPPAPQGKTLKAGQCPQCGHANPADSTFCENCGASFAPAPSVPTAPTPTPVPPQPAVPLPSGPEGLLVLPDGKELSIGARKTVGRLDLAKYVSPSEVGTISRQHLSIFVDNNAFYVQDEGSKNGTKLNGVDLQPQEKKTIKDGDEVLVAEVVKLIFKTKS